MPAINGHVLPGIGAAENGRDQFIADLNRAIGHVGFVLAGAGFSPEDLALITMATRSAITQIITANARREADTGVDSQDGGPGLEPLTPRGTKRRV